MPENSARPGAVNSRRSARIVKTLFLFLFRHSPLHPLDGPFGIRGSVRLDERPTTNPRIYYPPDLFGFTLMNNDTDFIKT